MDAVAWRGPSTEYPDKNREWAIAELGEFALRDSNVDGLIGLSVELLREVLHVDYVSVMHQPGADEPLRLVAGTGWNEAIEEGETIVSCGRGSHAGYTMLTHQPVMFEDLTLETRFTAPRMLFDHHVVAGMSVVIQGRRRPYGLLSVFTRQRRRFSESDGDFLRSVANIIGSAVEHRNAVARVEHSARYETALAECAQSLLASSGKDRIQLALEALFVATEATYVFLECNVVDAELGFCSQTIAEAEDPDAVGDETDDDYWALVPWDRMPTSRESLENGKPIVLIPELLDGPEYELYAEDPYPVKSELDVPVFVDGEWAGLIGFADQAAVREWSETDLSLLITAARMFGAFWEREAARERLEQASRAKDAFLASVSHELRTPLTAVVGFGRILQDPAAAVTEQERAELIDMVVTHGADLTNIISDLLVAARADLGNLEVVSVPVNLRAQVLQVLEALAREQAIDIELGGDSVRAVGDPDRVRQVVRNLVTNALRYGGDRIRLELINAGLAAKVLVCDNGTAIPEAERQRIFEPYQRAHNRPGVADSLGLGLAISRQLATLMGGDLTYRHEQGESIFEFTLPSNPETIPPADPRSPDSG